MNAGFDVEAINYDVNFTYTLIGKAQRAIVHHHLKKHLENPLHILEVNCGTGEDAIWLAKQKHVITATDISENMIAQAKSKTKLNNLIFLQLDCLKIQEKFNPDSFDFLFSNFGGLNCLTKKELNYFFENTASILQPKSKLALVIMPKNTLWEQLYFVLKGKFSEAFRRKKEKAIAPVSGESVSTYYYNPKDIVNLSKNNFKYIESKPIGFFIPPSYLESFVKKHQFLFKVLVMLDKWIKKLSFLSKYADHYLIVLEKK